VAELGGRMQARRGALVDALEGDGLVALEGDAAGEVRDAGRDPAGLISWHIGGLDSAADEAEIRVLVVEAGHRRSGVGSRLLEAAEEALRDAAVHTAWLVTTNDNLDALGFYQRRGWRLVELWPGAVDEERRRLKPTISRAATNGIPIRDELILAKELQEELSRRARQ
jgi:ribosomal protein S18 acetylase RimI-like enzyme